MHYRILVFNLQSLDEFNKEELHRYLLDVSFTTLCDQYQLDPALIEPARSNLEVVVSNEHTLPYFYVKYGSNRVQPLIIYEWDVESERGRGILDGVLKGETTSDVTNALLDVKSIIEIELATLQLKDMGLLLAYEIARWAANKGGGVILGLDKTWYRLNDHQAFIPIISINS
jgi:hypothetical protein